LIRDSHRAYAIGAGGKEGEAPWINHQSLASPQSRPVIVSTKLHMTLLRGQCRSFSRTFWETVRHAMLELPDLSADDARFFLLSCTSFVNYLKTRLE